MTKYLCKKELSLTINKEKINVYCGLILEIDGAFMRVRNRSNPSVIHQVSHQGQDIKISGKVLDQIDRLLRKGVLRIYAE